MRPTDFDIQRLIDYIKGTCKSLDDAIYDVTDGEMTEEELTKEDHAAIDEEIFKASLDQILNDFGIDAHSFVYEKK